MATWRSPDASERPVERREHVFVDPRPPKREKASRKGWEAIHAQFEYAVCTHCALRPIELHHVVSRSQGGDDVVENLCPLCHVCHMKLEGHETGWERVAASVRQYVILSRPRCVYVIGKIGWDRFNARYPMLNESEGSPADGPLKASQTTGSSDSLSDWEKYERPDERVSPWDLERQNLLPSFETELSW